MMSMNPTKKKFPVLLDTKWTSADGLATVEIRYDPDPVDPRTDDLDEETQAELLPDYLAGNVYSVFTEVYSACPACGSTQLHEGTDLHGIYTDTNDGMSFIVEIVQDMLPKHYAHEYAQTFYQKASEV